MLLSKRSPVRRFLLSGPVIVAIFLCATLIPIQVLAVPASAAEGKKEVEADEAPPLGDGKAKTVVPEVEKGDFKNPPGRNVLAERTSATAEGKKRRFKPGISKLVEQTEKTDVYDNGDGTRSVESYGAVVNFKDDKGQWRKIDSTLKTDNGKVRNAAGPVVVELNETPAADALGRIAIGERSIAFGLEGLESGVKGTTSANTITYPGSIAGADLNVQVLGERVKSAVILKTRPEAAPTYTMPLTLGGLTGATKADGGIVFNDEAGKEVIRVPQGWAWDSASPSIRSAVRVELAKDGKSLTIRPDAAWIMNPARAFPVTIDPDFIAAGVINPLDTFAESSQPNTNFNVNDQGGVYRDWAGMWPNGIEDYTYMKFDLGPAMNKEILNSELNLFLYDKSGGADDLVLRPVTDAWNVDTLTWNSRPNHGPELISFPPTPFTYNRVGVEPYVQKWANGSWANHGFAINTAGEPTAYSFGATEMHYRGGQFPYLYVEYNNAPVVGALTAPDDNAIVMTTRPTLTANAGSDADGDALAYWFRVSNTSHPEQGQIINSGWLPSPNWTIPEGSLINGVTYSWYLIVSDQRPQANYAFSPIRKMKLDLRLGAQTISPSDTNGPVSVNLVNGNVTTSTASPSMKAIGGDLGLSYTYNSQAQSTMGLTGRYFPGCGSRGEFSPNPYVVRTDPNIDFNWRLDSPLPPGESDDNWCAKWTGFISVPEVDQYCFEASSDDGIRVRIDGNLVLDNWSDGGQPTSQPSNCVGFTTLSRSIQVEYYENGGEASVQLKVSSGRIGLQPVPATWLSTTPSALPHGWQLSAGDDTAQSYTKAVITEGAVVLVDPSGETHEYKRTGTGEAAGFTPPADERTTLRVVPGSAPPHYVAQADDGLSYTFNEKGALDSVVSNPDAKAPASAQYIYEPGFDTARLSAIKDPVSGRQISLRYSNGRFGVPPLDRTHC